ncbi:hypothetical protein CYMTET_18926 [Cymbomonas tetramitiformis]|uniref:Uncharacterized protein n=1 Tax=Cymbomonas tetramitiformis TaxID=36881 RepID=A0AAE0L5G5_9CHLO|nr:hypothetical protein CYMTET_18926 [Cymbomonas tetramitiformis]
MVPKRVSGLLTECVMVALGRMRVDPEAYKLFFFASASQKPHTGREQALERRQVSPEDLAGYKHYTLLYVKSEEDTRHEDPLGALHLAAPLQTVLERVQERHPVDGMPGARGEMGFIAILGVPVEKAEVVSKEMLKKVEELFAILPNKLGHAQAGGGGGNWRFFIHHKLRRVVFEVATSAYPLTLALHDDFAGHLAYSPNHGTDVAVLDAEGPGQRVLFDVATMQPISEAYLRAAMMAPGAAARKVEKNEVMSGNRRFRERRYVDANVGAEEEVDDDGGEDEDEEAALGSSMG